MKSTALSIVVLNYNTKDLLFNCISSLRKVNDKTTFEILVVDNGSNDGSIEMLGEFFPKVKLIKNKKNFGFAKGNNAARKHVKSKYVLFLNTDTLVDSGVLDECVSYMENDKSVGALTCKLVMSGGSLDKDARRSFPTPWVAFTHFSGLDRVFPKSKLFSRYWYGYLPADKTHEVDVLQGAFLLTKKKILDQVGWFSEDYFLDGEDIDLSWKIKQRGFKLVYYPKVSIVHLKGFTKGKNKSQSKKSKKERLKYVMSGMNAMEIFYKKHLSQNYNAFINFFVYLGIKTLKAIRYIKVQVKYLI